MLARSTCLCGRGALLVLSLAPLAAAQSPIPPQSPAPPPAVLWYRSSEGCPDSASFLTSIGERASLVRLAEAGDHVDFVVNLSATKEGAHGRLEVETERGTVAIREAQDDSCERVAQVIALNLALALEPGSSEAPGTPPHPQGQRYRRRGTQKPHPLTQKARPGRRTNLRSQAL